MSDSPYVREITLLLSAHEMGGYRVYVVFFDRVFCWTFFGSGHICVGPTHKPSEGFRAFLFFGLWGKSFFVH